MSIRSSGTCPNALNVYQLNILCDVNFKIFYLRVGKIINLNSNYVSWILLAKPKLTQLVITCKDFRLILILNCIFNFVDFKIYGISFLAFEKDKSLVHRQVILVLLRLLEYKISGADFACLNACILIDLVQACIFWASCQHTVLTSESLLLNVIIFALFYNLT